MASSRGSGTVAGVVSPLHLMAYGPDGYVETVPDSLEAARATFGRAPVTWLNINRNDPTTLQGLESLFGIHPLAMEDIQNARQRPKTEDYGDYLFLVGRTPYLEDGEVRSEQLCLILGRDWLITIQEEPGDVFEPVRDRIRAGRSRIRGSHADYLAYAILDAVVDSYFPLLETVGTRLEDLEELAVSDPSSPVSRDLVQIRRQLLLLRRTAWPQRESLAFLERGDHPVLSREVRPFFRDVYDHTIRIIDVIEVYRELASDIQDLHLSGVNTRMNEVMKILTIIATVFIPLTFITGLYGMNFDTEAGPLNMPELRLPYGYPMVLVVMGMVAASLLLFFRRKGWF